MKLKLTLQTHPAETPIDLTTSVESSTTVGDFADYLVSCRTAFQVDTHDSYTLALAPTQYEFNSAAALETVGIRSGATISVVPRSKSLEQVQRKVAATLRVVSGPDVGAEFLLFEGMSIVGRDPTCDVQLNDPLMSRRHARVRVGESIEISDLGSSNGVLIGDFFADAAVLGPDDLATLGDTIISVSRTKPSEELEDSGLSFVSFNRPPQIEPKFAGRTFSVPEPPSRGRTQRFPIIPLFAPLLMGAVLYAATRNSTSLIFMAMSPLMMLGNVVEGQMSGKRNYRREESKFRSAVEELRREASTASLLEIEGRSTEEPAINECIDAISKRSSLLWSKRPDMDTFGSLRLGLGCQASRSKFEFPLRRQTDPDLYDELHEMLAPFSTVEKVPVVADLEHGGGALGVAGSIEHARAVARGYVLQLLSLHSPAEVTLYGICGPRRAGEWEWVKWLPHCEGVRSPLAGTALVSTKPGCLALIGELESLVSERSESRQTGDTRGLPRIILLLDEPVESEWSRLVQLVAKGKECGIWTVWVADSAIQLPSCCRTVVEVGEVLDESTATFVDRREVVYPLKVDPLPWLAAEKSAREMSPIVDSSAREVFESDLPRSVSFLALSGEDLAEVPERVIERWVENRSLLSGPFSSTSLGRGRPGNLRAIVGESVNGPHVLDLRLDGPHALVGGTTGSGKSELLQSWIMGMAVSNSPQRLTFLLVDYKGGSAFSDCVNLPHTVGLVTDLSPYMVRRALMSLSAELTYREHLLHRKRAKDLASLERDGDSEAPPSLVIIVDEFAALVKEVPEFVDGVVNVAQRGRSLGLHLILATQRPSGVIRDNLRANTNLRIALRMADANDSTDVIGTKVAATFDPSSPGRAASRTGPTALVPFQASYLGGWTTTGPKRPDIVVSTFGFSPKTTWEPPIEEETERPAEGPTDIQRLVIKINEANELAEIEEPRKPWMAPIESFYDLAKLIEVGEEPGLIFGIGDKPATQSQPLISFSPDVDGNIAIFGTGNSGKSTLLRTLCVAAGLNHPRDLCHVYGLDFGTRGLQMLEQLPHVGSIINGGDIERLSRLFTMLRQTIDERAVAFAGIGAGSLVQYRNILKRGDVPRILVLIDGMGAMRTALEGTEHHKLFESFLSVVSDGRQVGVHFALSADRAAAVPSALGALIQRRVVLRLADENSYAMLGQPNDVLTPKSPPGRGLCDELEIQVAILGQGEDTLAQDLACGDLAKELRAAGLHDAPPIRSLADFVQLDGLETSVDGKPSFGVAGDTLQTVGFVPNGTFSVAGPPGSGRTTALLTLVKSYQRWEPSSQVVLFSTSRSSLKSDAAWYKFAATPPEAANLARELVLSIDNSVSSIRLLLVIENLVDYSQTEADAPLQELIKKAISWGHLVISDGEVNGLNGLQQLVQLARSSRVGIVLAPEQADATLFRTQFPRMRKSDFPPGRGLYVGRGVLPVVVQVATTNPMD